MSPVFKLLVTMILLLVGINLTANNTFHSFMLNYVLHTNKSSTKSLRFLGIVLMASALLFVMNLNMYANLVFFTALVIFIYLFIKGRSNYLIKNKQERLEAQQSFESEMKIKRRRLQEKKKEIRKDLEKQKSNEQAKDHDEMTHRVWDEVSAEQSNDMDEDDADE